MPPKQALPSKKLTKQELKALKKEQKEKRKEEARKLAEEKKRLAEEEAKRLEEEARLAWEAEQARLQAEHDRIAKEKESLSFFFNWRTGILANLEVAASSLVDVYLGTEELALIEQQKGNFNLVNKFQNYMKNLETLVQMRIDRTTAYILERSHEFWKQNNESTFSAILGEWKIFLWINHAKNPRLRTLDVPSLSLAITIPKVFTFANVAIRIYHQVINPLLISCNEYNSVGGVFVLDILAVPPASRSVKSWNFEHVTLMTNCVVQLGYPLAVGGSGTAPASVTPSPIGLEFPVPETIIVSEKLPEIGWWDESRVRQYPYESWILNPISECKALFTLHSHMDTVKIEVGSGWCKLVETPHSECNHLVGQEMAPIILLKKLSRCGMHLMPVDADGQFVRAPIKSKNVKLLLYKSKGNAILNMTEHKSKEYQEKFSGEFHASMIVTLQNFISEGSLAKIQKGDPGFTECFKSLALGLRIFSFSSCEWNISQTTAFDKFPLEPDLTNLDKGDVKISGPLVPGENSLVTENTAILSKEDLAGKNSDNLGESEKPIIET